MDPKPPKALIEQAHDWLKAHGIGTSHQNAVAAFAHQLARELHEKWSAASAAAMREVERQVTDRERRTREELLRRARNWIASTTEPHDAVAQEFIAEINAVLAEQETE